MTLLQYHDNILHSQGQYVYLSKNTLPQCFALVKAFVDARCGRKCPCTDGKLQKPAVAGALWHRIQRIWLQQCILAIMPETNTNASDPHINDFASASKSLLLMYNSTEAAS